MLRLEEINPIPDDKILYFDNDDEFYQFCVNPKIVTTEYTTPDGQQGWTADWDYSDGYVHALNNGNYFMIKDENSQIYKHGAITHRVNTKPVNNLLPYFKPPKSAAMKSVTSLDKYVNDYSNNEENI